jgi:RNA polymerase sigma factor (sigma-70 family)
VWARQYDGVPANEVWRRIVIAPAGDEAGLEELAKRCATGDQGALDTLLRRIHPEVLRRCAAALWYRSDAEEACQDVLLQVARNIGGFEHRSKFRTWLYVIIGNCVRQTYRSLKHRAAEHPMEILPTQRPDPRTTSVIAGARIDLLEAIERLEQRSPDLVAPFVLREVSDLEYSEICRQLNLPLSTVKFRIHEARKFVQRHLADGS